VRPFRLVQTDRGFAVYFVYFLGICVTLPFMMVLTLLLADLGLPKPWIGPAMTISGHGNSQPGLAADDAVAAGAAAAMLVGLGCWAVT
jgi:hypothetical protein